VRLRFDVKQEPTLVRLDLAHPVAAKLKDRIQPLLGRHADSFWLELLM